MLQVGAGENYGEAVGHGGHYKSTKLSSLQHRLSPLSSSMSTTVDAMGVVTAAKMLLPETLESFARSLTVSITGENELRRQVRSDCLG
jgi:hypothetical protein